ncbi:MAG: Na(+)-translocating NADH-quinone reductase subunit A [Flavobacteriales bacterium]|nr:Na(+)-translocating NADH-quinone reductase subunit A [Flavobacteriales bacterium]
MPASVKIRKGLDVRLKGAVQGAPHTLPAADRFSIHPTDFHGLVPRMAVKAGAEVKAGEVLFTDKKNPDIKFVSGIAGTVQEPVRGEKRRILRVDVMGKGTESVTRDALNPASADGTAVRSAMLEGGFWPMLRQRPFDVMPAADSTPRDIFVSGFDSTPLAPTASMVLEGRMEAFRAGLTFLNSLLADGRKVQLGVQQGDNTFSGVTEADLTAFSGPHPAGNVGVQIHEVRPINKGEVVWTMGMQDVANIGEGLTSGAYVGQRRVALTGARSQPALLQTSIGTTMANIIQDRVLLEGTRVISGNVLTGTTRGEDGALGYHDQQVTCIPEGDEPQFFITKGWLGPGFDKFSASRAFPTWLMPKGKEYDLNTNNNGEERAFVVSGQYDAVFPFDIYPVQLLKSILVGDIDRMEKLGIYEVAPEDFALCEYVCTSKMAVQDMVRKGLDQMIEEFA